jgi:acetyltransferase-like isoleucine patch superfamily enzyme
LSLKTQIFADETSKIIIEDGVVIKDNVNIMATNNSIVRICRGAFIDKETIIWTDEYSEIEFKDNAIIGKQSDIRVYTNSSVVLNGENNICNNLYIFAKESFVSIGKFTTAGPYFYITCQKTKIDIGDDNMVAANVRICAGDHKLIDRKSGEEITNRKRIKTGNHVWIGNGATLLAGSDILENSIVGAASVVTKRVEAFSACAGNPVKVIKRDIDWKR